MPTPTYDLIEEKVLGSDLASVTFSSIPGTYKDIVLESIVRINRTANTAIYCQPNGNTTANKSFTNLTGNGTAASSTRATNDAYIQIGLATGTTNPSGNFAYGMAHFMSYANTNVNKTILVRAANAEDRTSAIVGLFPSTSAISSIVIYGDALANILTGSTFRLWGVSG